MAYRAMVDGSPILKHYLREDVQMEVSKFCRDRWVALEAKPAAGRRVFYRYADGRPITIREPADVKRIINRFMGRNIRTIYATANTYRKLLSKEDVEGLRNVSRTTPTIDVDGNLEETWLTIQAARAIIEEINRSGASESVYLVWSGRGIHVHLNEKAISERYWEENPVSLAHMVVEYILRGCRQRLMEIVGMSRSREKRLKIENIMDVQRVFTSPLSVHRELDIVAVTVKPEELDSFDLEWARLEKFRYWREWDRYVEGELDRLVEKALQEIKAEGVTRTILGEETESVGAPQKRSVGRFQVMALLQAARYYVLNGDMDRAKSFGLNRAIFYAWAKRRGVTVRRPAPGAVQKHAGTEEVEETVGNEVVYRTARGWYTIGGQEQTPREFDRQVVQRFGAEAFQRYWESAIEYVKQFPIETIKDQRGFYERVYLPVRDDVEKILRMLRSPGST